MSVQNLKNFHGFLVLDKPKGLSSHQALRFFKKKFPKIKIGHTGTLDPLATGVLVVAVGEATKLIQFLSEKEKVYQAQARLGIATTTDDSEGEVLTSRPVPSLTKEQVEKVFKNFLGKNLQKPPLYSALKVKGKALYRYARQGESPEFCPREVKILQLDLQQFEPPSLSFFLRCSRGTYVRALIRDLGERLGTAAHMSALRRLESGIFSLKPAWTLEKFGQKEPSEWPWIKVEEALDLPQFSLDSSIDCERLQNGVRLRSLHSKIAPLLQPGQVFGIIYQGQLQAVATFKEPLFQLNRVLRRSP